MEDAASGFKSTRDYSKNDQNVRQPAQPTNEQKVDTGLYKNGGKVQVATIGVTRSKRLYPKGK